MSVSKMVAGAGGLMALLASAGAGTAVAAEPCGLGAEYQVTAVSPFKRPVETGGYADNPTPVLLGADIRVAAWPGLTAEWLERKLEAQFAAGECQLGVGHLAVDVLPEGDVFVVRLTSSDETGVPRHTVRAPEARAANEILRWASALAPAK